MNEPIEMSGEEFIIFRVTANMQVLTSVATEKLQGNRAIFDTDLNTLAVSPEVFSILDDADVTTEVLKSLQVTVV